MTVTRDVVRDLLPVYLAGEASLDTRKIVEEYAAHDPVIQAEIDGANAPPISFPATAAAPTSEKAALDRTRALMKTRTSTLVVAVLFSVLPFSFAFSGWRITFLVCRDAPVVAAAWWATAAAMWIWHARVRRRLSVAGL